MTLTDVEIFQVGPKSNLSAKSSDKGKTWYFESSFSSPRTVSASMASAGGYFFPIGSRSMEQSDNMTVHYKLAGSDTWTDTEKPCFNKIANVVSVKGTFTALEQEGSQEPSVTLTIYTFT